MSDQDERLAAELQDYYRQLARQQAPDLQQRVLAAGDARARRRRLLAGIAGGGLAAASLAVVVVVALANHNQPIGPSPGPGASASPSASASPTVVPTAPSVPVGLAAHGFVPADVTATSSDEWWVLGWDRQCAIPAPAGPNNEAIAAECTRVLHTTDGGHTFVSIPTPPVAVASGQRQPDRLRFADQFNGWVVSGLGVVWSTHDGGAHWIHDGGAGSVTDLEASGGAVYAVTCAGASGCTVERSPTRQDSWTTLAASAGHGSLNHLSVNGAHVWVAIESQAGGLGWLLASTDSGQNFTRQTACPSALGYANEYAVDSSTLWATCATGTEASAFQSLDGGQQFTQLAGTVMLPNSASIAGVSSTTAVIGGQGLLRTTDGGQTFATVENMQAQWTMVGFTTQVNGFAFALTGPGQSELWRTDDAGAHWHQVPFP
ncbi:MAG TPA: hypothetical protein VIO13_06170 [Candidatus Dormibacteraeota bacterium]